MRHALTAAQLRAAEVAAVAAGISLSELMERAGLALAEAVGSSAPEGRVSVLCGGGNNGGDGWVAARALHEGGRVVLVIACVPPDDLLAEAAAAANAAIASGVAWTAPPDAAGVRDALSGSSAAVDALLGIGLRDAPRGLVGDAVAVLRSSRIPVISADVPSGVEADTGRVPGAAVRADVTVTFTSLKPGLLIYPGAGLAGEVRVADVGVPPEATQLEGALELWDSGEYAGLLPLPPPEAHKNERGRVLVVAGSRAYVGAAALAARGALRMGAGYVTVAVPESVVRTMQAKLTAPVVVGLPEGHGGTLASKVADALADMAREHDAAVVGPGLTVAQGTVLLVRHLVRDLALPLVLDADGLNALVDAVDMLLARAAPTVITPHPGELGRLVGATPDEVQSDRVSFARRLAGPSRACVLKGARTVTAGGGRAVVTQAGNPGMATAGAGDVLAGMTGTLLAQGMTPFQAGALAAHLHGVAGDLAAASLTVTCMTAEDIPEYLPPAVKSLTERREDRRGAESWFSGPHAT